MAAPACSSADQGFAKSKEPNLGTLHGGVHQTAINRGILGIPCSASSEACPISRSRVTVEQLKLTTRMHSQASLALQLSHREVRSARISWEDRQKIMSLSAQLNQLMHNIKGLCPAFTREQSHL